MRILDEAGDKALKSASLFLTVDEAQELRDTLEQLLAKPEDNHGHVADAEFKKELTISLYKEGSAEGFDERSRRLILTDE
jgi:hypothetical protein